MKLFFKSKPLELPALTRLRDPIEITEWWINAEEQYKDTLNLLLGFNQPGGPGIHSLQRGLHTFLPFGAQLDQSGKREHARIPDIRHYLASIGITDRARQDAFIDVGDDSPTPRILVNKEAADVHEKMARATRQSGFGRNNPGFEFGDSAEIASHDFGDIRYFEHPATRAPVPLFHVRRAVVVNRGVHNDSSSSNLYADPQLHSRIIETFALGDHPSYGYLGITHTHPALSHVSPSMSDLKVHDRSTPYGYSHIIRPGINMKEFTRQVIARYGSPREAIRQWRAEGDDKNMAARYDQIVGNQNPLTARTGIQDRHYAEGKDATGMSLGRDSGVFLLRHPSNPLLFPRSTRVRRQDQAVNFGSPSDFTSAHPHHVIYLGEETGSKRGTQQSIIPRSLLGSFIQTRYGPLPHFGIRGSSTPLSP